MISIQIALSIVLFSMPTIVGHADAVDKKKIAALVEQALESWQVPGSSVVIVNGDSILYLEGHGLREKGKAERISPDTVFPLASCSKAFTTTLMAMLVDDGKLAWDDRVRKHLEYFHLSDPLADGDVRLRDLVSHRTGVAGNDLLWYRAPWSQEEMIRRVGQLPLAAPFRTAMQYQSIMFTAAGHATANAAGEPWENLIRRRILKPLGSKSTSLSTEEALKVVDHASPHRHDRLGNLEVVPWYEIKEPNAAGSINTSARDLAHWLQLHLNEGLHGEARLVSAANLRATHSPQITIPMDDANQRMHPYTQQMSYGMAWTIQDYRGELLVSHSGIIDGFRAHLTLLPKRKLGLAILSNCHATRMNLALSNQLVDLLLNAPAKDWNDHYHKILEAEEFATKLQIGLRERQRKTSLRPTLPLADYVGNYEAPAYGTAKIRLDKDHLILEWSSFKVGLQHYRSDSFQVLDDLLDTSLLEFHIEDGKRVKSMTAIDVLFTRK